MCGCSQMTTTTMELPSLVCLCVLISCGVSSADANEPVKVVVMEEDDVILPCSLSTKENIESNLFDWKKDGQKEVFLFNSGDQYNNNISDAQDRQFKGRVFHFQDELQHGNASIIIRNTKVADSGKYTCHFPHQPSKTFHIELVVEYKLRDRTEEKIPGAAKRPNATINKVTEDGLQLKCVVSGAFPQPQVEWLDSDGRVISSEKPQVSKTGDLYYVTLITTVTETKTDRYRCVTTQREIFHVLEDDVYVHGAASKPSVTILKRDNEVLLQCEVLGVSPKTQVEWKDSSGNIVPAKEPKITDRGGSYDIILEALVTKTDNFRCVVTQKEIDHQIYAEIYVPLGDSTGWIVAVSVLSILLVLVVGGVLFAKGILKVDHITSRRRHENGSGNPPVSHHENGVSLRTEPLLPGSDVPAQQTSPV